MFTDRLLVIVLVAQRVERQRSPSALGLLPALKGAGALARWSAGEQALDPEVFIELGPVNMAARRQQFQVVAPRETLLTQDRPSHFRAQGLTKSKPQTVRR